MKEIAGSVIDCLLVAILPILKLITLTLFGLILSHPKVQLIPISTFKILSKLVFFLFLPCLIFTHLGPNISVGNLLKWWFLPVNVIISIIIGCLLGCIVSFICRPPREFVRFTIIMIAFGNTGNIPLAVIATLCRDSDNPFGTGCYYNGVTYVSLSQWIAVILVYTLVYHMMEPPLEPHEASNDEDDNEIEELEVDVSAPLLVEAEWLGIEDQEIEYCKTPFIARLFNSELDISETEGSNLGNFVDTIEEEVIVRGNPESIRCLAKLKMVKRIGVVAKQTPFRNIVQPSFTTFVLAIIIGAIPLLKKMVYGEDAPLEVITDSLAIIAEATVPSVLLILGGMLAEGPNQSNLGIRTTIGIIVARLFVLPAIGIVVVHFAGKWNLLLSSDSLYRFVLLLQYATPSAILLGAVASLRGYAVKEALALLFWQHACAVVSMSLYIILYIQLLLSYS